MPTFTHRAVVAALLAIVLALVAHAQSIYDFPQIACSKTNLEHCSQCHYTVYNGETFYLCATCEDTETTRYSQASLGEHSGTCQVYNGYCNVADCDKCASDDPSVCMTCNFGVPDEKDSQCYGRTISSATGGAYTSSKTPVKAPTIANTTTTTAPKPTTTTTATLKPTTTTTTTTTTTPKPTTTTTATLKPTAATNNTTPTTNIPCGIGKCTTCATSGTTCSVCYMGYTVTHTGACMPSGLCEVTNCVQCSATNAARCTTCAAGYTANTNGKCKRNDANSAVSSPTAALTMTAAMMVALAAVF